MRRHGFVEKGVEPVTVYTHIKQLLQKEGFKVASEDIKENLWDMHARKSSPERIVFGRVRDVDVIVAGARDKFEVQLKAGMWGRDLLVPAIEGIATVGIAAAAELHSAHQFEERLWEQIVHNIDPSLKICELDGLLFKTQEELNAHMKLHEQQRLMTVGMGRFGMYGMGMGGMGLWI